MEFADFVDYVIDKDNARVSVVYKNLDFIKDPMRIQIFPKPVDLISIDYYKNDIFLDSKECLDDEKWKYINEAQFRGLCFDKVICYVDKYDEVLELFASLKNDVTFILDKDIDINDKEKITTIAKKKKVSVVYRIDAVRV